MNKQLFPTALRELRTDLASRNVIIGLILTGFILGLSGPFDTLRLIPLIPRLVYWTAVVFSTFAVGSLVSQIISQLAKRRPLWLLILISSLAVGTAVTGVLTVLNFVAFGVLPDSVISAAIQWALVTLISTAIEVSAKLMAPKNDNGPAAAILDRLPFSKRGALVALSAEDHYVKIETTQGTEMVLMRLSDAINEVGKTAGLQIHRSHWVALDQITDVRRINDRGEVVLSSGQTRPISRGYMAAVRDAGLLPRGRNG